MRAMAKINNHVIALGGSAGGIEAIVAILEQLPSDLQAIVVIATHRDPNRESKLRKILQNVSRMTVVEAENGTHINCETCYVGPASARLVLDGDRARLVEHGAFGSYNCIDDLFESVATSASNKAVGVILSGLRRDGVRGLGEIKSRGGIAIAQAPWDAAYPDMPEYAIAAVEPDYIGDVNQIAKFLVRHTGAEHCE